MQPPGGNESAAEDPMAALMSASSAIAHEIPTSTAAVAAAAEGDDGWLSSQVGDFDAAAVADANSSSLVVMPQQNQNQQIQSSQPSQQHQQVQPFDPPPSSSQQQQQQRFCAAMHPHQFSPDAVLCSRCGYAGADVRIKSCPNGCAFHARCIDLIGLANTSASSSGQTTNRDDDYIRVRTCPSCQYSGPNVGLEIIPLSFTELDRVQRSVSQKIRMMGGHHPIGTTTSNGMILNSDSAEDITMGGGGNKKRTNSELLIDYNDLSTVTTAMSTSKCYDPSIPRTGRWTDEELAFRDTIIGHFLDGSLPLSNGLKLNDFLSSILKSKQSRLTKKMKHAKLSTKYFRLKDGYIRDLTRAKEFSEQEFSFVTCVSDPVERSEIQFHMQREWRDHLAERCTYLRITFDADKWLQSVDMMDRRVVLEKNRSRMNKRRMLMGKALETDVTDSIPGVFINQDSHLTDDALFVDDTDAMKEKMMNGSGGSGSGGNAKGEKGGDFGEFLMSMMEDKGSSSAMGNGKKSESQTSDPNFRYAAPFLAAITSYMERNFIPFEHVDLWVPSFVPPSLDKEMGSAPQMAHMGSGANLAAMEKEAEGNETCRLCFAGSATLNVQVIEPANRMSRSTSMTSIASLDDKHQEALKNVSPLSADEIFSFSLYGDYSEKFSFNVGSGLPGRVFKTGIAAWEQFVSNAPSHMFERRGGAMQFGVKTALGLPIESPNVGRIVLVMYSRHNREKDEELVNRVVKDMRLFNPCPRWKLVVSVSPAKGENNQTSLSSDPPSKLENVSNNNAVVSQKESQIKQLISLLGENMPSASDSTTPLGQKIHSIMNLRLTLLRHDRSTEEEQLVDTLLVLFESYVSAGRSNEDIVLLVTRDYDFHTKHNQHVSMIQQQQQQQQHQQQQQTPILMSISPPMPPPPGAILNQGMHTFNHSSSAGSTNQTYYAGNGGYHPAAPPPSFLPPAQNQLSQPQMQSFSHPQQQINPQFNGYDNSGGRMHASASNASLNEA